MSRFDAAAEDLRRISLEENATASEKLRLIAERDPQAIIVRLDPSMGGDLLANHDDAPVKLDDTLSANPTAPTLAIVRRVRLRVELGLPRRDCNARRQRVGCSCLAHALDRLLDVEGVNREWVASLARDVHKKLRAADRERKRAEKAQRKLADLRVKAAKETATDTQTAATRQAPAGKPTEAKPKPRYRRREPPHPLSIEAFRRSQQGPSIRGIDRRDLW